MHIPGLDQRAPAVLLIVVLATLAAAQQAYQPKFAGDPAHSEAEAAALGYMRTAVMAEKLYQRKHASYATTLAGLVGSGSFTRRMVDPNRGDYTVGFHGRKESYTLTMTPQTFDAEHRAFWVNENGIIHYETDKPATQESPVLKAD